MPLAPRTALVALLASLIAWPVACAVGEPLEVPAEPRSESEPSEPPPSTGPARATDSGAPSVDPNHALAPSITSVTPSRATVGSVGPSVVVTGSEFVARTIVQLDGAPLATTFISSSELRATIPTSRLATVGALRLSVGTSPPGGGASTELIFEVENPGATLSAIAPLSVLAGSAATLLEVHGAAFVPGAKVVFGATDLPTDYLGSTSLSALVPASLLGVSASIPVRVENPAPGGGPSNVIAFTVANPSAAISAISPAAAYVGSAALPIVVSGGGFVSGSKVVFNGADLQTAFVNAGEVRATIPASSLAAAGEFPVAIANPPPGGGVSAPVVFRVQYPAPTAISLAPATIAAGSGATTVTVTGVGFFLTSQITFDGAPVATTYLDSTRLRATLSAAEVASADTLSVRVVTPAPGGGTSAALPLTITNGVPTIAGLTPTSVVSGSPDRSITITGTAFVPASTVKSNGVNVMTTYVSNTQLTAVVPSSQLLYPGSVALTVTNPSPGGGTSAPRNLTVGCDTSGVDVALGPVGTTTTLPTSFAGAPLMPRFAESGLCVDVTLLATNQQPGRFWVVQNTAGVPVTLSAWADCTADGKQGDAFLTFYRRPTVPADAAERLGCAFTVAEGLGAPGGYSSPERGVSDWCPGLTKANGGGLTLGVCEKAVVHIQPWSMVSTTFTAPPLLRVRPE